MKKNKIVVGGILQKSRFTLRTHFRTICKLLIISVSPFILAMILMIALLNLFPDSIIAMSAPDSVYFLKPWDTIFTWIQVFALLGSFYFVLGLLKAQIRLIRGERPTEKSLFATSGNQFFQYLLALILTMIFVFALLFLIFGSIDLIIGEHYDSEMIKAIKYIFVGIRTVFVIASGIYFGIRLQFFKFFITKGENTIAAFKESRKITDGYERKLFHLVLSYIGITLVAFLLWSLLFATFILILNTITGMGLLGGIISVILVSILAAGYFALILFAYATKEFSLTQAFLELHEEEEK